MANNVITDIESKTKAGSIFSVRDLFFVIGYIVIAYMLRGFVNVRLMVPYFIFSILCAIFLVCPSKYNKGRNNLESIFVLLRTDLTVYRPFMWKEEVSDGE